MLEAMIHAEVGDDVLGDDPTVVVLEELAAAKTGFEAGLYMPSGTMSNQVALATHTHPGEAVIFERQAHMLYYEVGAPGIISGVISWTIEGHDGYMDPAEVERVITHESEHTPGTSLICVEDTHNRHGGTVVPLDVLEGYRAAAAKHGVKLHMDGARVFNAAVAQGVDVKEIVKGFDSVSICLSKGLRCPVGSVLLGSREFIGKARRVRKRLGGGMRQVGLLAAAGILALEKYVDRLADDHRRAKELAVGINQLKGISVNMASVQTNMVMADTELPVEPWHAALTAAGIGCFPVAPNRLRFVFHADLNDEHVALALSTIRSISQSLS
jgi:threonine aldolase